MILAENMRVDIRTPLIEDVAYIAVYMRAVDREEIAARGGFPPGVALRHSLDLSHEAWCGLVDDVPVCLFGLGVGVTLSQIARPWLLATDKIDANAVAFLRRNREFVRRWSASWKLENWVDARNLRSIEWLRWLGFTIDAPTPVGGYGYLFHRFWKERT